MKLTLDELQKRLNESKILRAMNPEHAEHAANIEAIEAAIEEVESEWTPEQLRDMQLAKSESKYNREAREQAQDNSLTNYMGK